MFGIKEWRQTKFYQEVELETKLEIALRLLNMGLDFSVEQIAQALDLKVEVVRKAIEKQSGGES
ncbi:MAG: hypothetical protein KI793_34885 [Rivularia sp. (in: Bacteria)]|nr:hypothetical protein [Rivularia sp. MS3]